MSSAESSLPPPARLAAQNALNAALNENSADRSDDGDASDGQEVSVDIPAGLNGLPLNDSARTVFEDPTTFNVKHPLYSSWTLWFDSPATKNRSGGVPQTPISASAAVPPTPLSAQAQGWMEDIKKVISFDSVEEFWGVYNNIIPPSQLPQKANYYLFKEGIIPAWEDEANKWGGKWSIQLPRDKNRERIDKMWLYTMLAAIGETFDQTFTKSVSGDSTEELTTAPPTSLVTGVIVSTRPQFYRLSIWTRLAPGVSVPPNATTTRALTSNGFSPALPPHPSEEGDGLRERIENIGRHFKTNVLGFPEAQKLGGPLATEVEFASHKDSEKKGRGKKLVI
ncbi:eukaryotic translation initiation factor 4E [Tulasnella sp. 419]|nr:eukaryotic translation initiation factor 4E [Tulasnella sp. 418]KAG8939095.1 eukaryotic translation initiation factor 4E [Tulasnella sp. 419]